MGLKGGYACLKYTVFFVNIIFWLAGVGVLAFSLWLRFGKGFDGQVGSYTGTYLLMGAGSLITVVGFLGCCGASKESPCMLTTFFFFLLIIMVLQIAAGVWASSHRPELNKKLHDLVRNMVKDYNKDPVKTESIDALQKLLHCCGTDGPSNWSIKSFNGSSAGGGSVVGNDSMLNVSTYWVPQSCCAERQRDTCNATVTINIEMALPDYIYTEGCVAKATEFANKQLTVIAGVGFGVGALELFGMIFSMMLCCAIRNQ